MGVVLFGAGDHAREVAEIVVASGQELLGYVDGNSQKHGLELDGFPILGGESWLRENKNREGLQVLPAVGSCAVLATMARKLEEWQIPLGQAIHPRALVSPRATLSPGCILFPNAVVNTGAVLGQCVCLNVGASVSHDSHVGSFSILNPGARVAGRVTIGKGCYLGMGCHCIQGLRIGEGTTVGAGGVVIRNLDPKITAVGVPARTKC